MCSFVESKYHLTKYIFKIFSNRKAPHKMSSYFQSRKSVLPTGRFTYGWDPSGWDFLRPRSFRSNVPRARSFRSSVPRAWSFRSRSFRSRSFRSSLLWAKRFRAGLFWAKTLRAGLFWAKTLRAGFPISQLGREHSGRVFLLVGPGENIQVEFSFWSGRARSFRSSFPFCLTGREHLGRVFLGRKHSGRVKKGRNYLPRDPCIKKLEITNFWKKKSAQISS